MAFTDSEKTDIRRFCGYPAYGAAAVGLRELALLPGLRVAGVPHEQSVRCGRSRRAALPWHADRAGVRGAAGRPTISTLTRRRCGRAIATSCATAPGCSTTGGVGSAVSLAFRRARRWPTAASLWWCGDHGPRAVAGPYSLGPEYRSACHRRQTDAYRPSGCRGASGSGRTDSCACVRHSRHATAGSLIPTRMATHSGTASSTLPTHGPGDYLVQADAIWFIAAQQRLVPVLCVQTNRIVSFSRPAAPSSTGVNTYGGVITATNELLLTNWPASVLGVAGRGHPECRSAE